MTATAPVLCTDSASLARSLVDACARGAGLVTADALPEGGSPLLLGLLARERAAASPAPVVVLVPADGWQASAWTVPEPHVLVTDTTSTLLGPGTIGERRYVVGTGGGRAEDIRRLWRLVDGGGPITPNRDEHAMFAAYGAALRSAALRGGVGAAVVDDEGDVVALGTAEVPAPGGGQYWDGDPGDARDFRRGGDPATAVRTGTVRVLLDLLAGRGVRLPGPGDELAADLLRQFDREQGSHGVGHGGTAAQTFESLGRVVHAEMAALCAAARSGTALRGRTLYTTALPCRQCLRHLVCAGLRRVVHWGPGLDAPPAFHDDSVRVGGEGPELALVPFTGLAPGAWPWARSGTGPGAPPRARLLADLDAELDRLSDTAAADRLRAHVPVVRSGAPDRKDPA